MQAANIYLIALAEVAALLLVVCLFLVLQNRSLKGLVKKLQARMTQLVADLKTARAAKQARTSEQPEESYKHFLNSHIEQTKNHHQSLEENQDIVLDLDPKTPLPRRVAALRYALLLAEKEATSETKGEHTNWKLLLRKYQQLFAFQEQYGDEENDQPEVNEELDTLREELTSAKKRINNLERFKALYFDLEEKWESCKDSAQTHFNELTQLAANTDNAEAIETALQSYHASYADIGALIEGGVEGATIVAGAESGAEGSAGEIRHLRAVAADQHKIITELQRKLKEAVSTEEKEQVVTELQGELQKQIRFVQESETCIQLLEDELSSAHKETEQLKTRLNRLPQIKTELKELRDQNEDFEMQLYTLKSENRRLMGALKKAKTAPPDDDNSGEVRKLKKHISDLESQYAELEEKFLDLKLQQ